MKNKIHQTLYNLQYTSAQDSIDDPFHQVKSQ